MNEIWKQVNQTEYYLSNLSNFKRITKEGNEHSITGWFDGSEYKIVSYYENNKRIRIALHIFKVLKVEIKTHKNYKFKYVDNP